MVKYGYRHLQSLPCKWSDHFFLRPLYLILGFLLIGTSCNFCIPFWLILGLMLLFSVVFLTINWMGLVHYFGSDSLRFLKMYRRTLLGLEEEKIDWKFKNSRKGDGIIFEQTNLHGNAMDGHRFLLDSFNGYFYFYRFMLSFWSKVLHDVDLIDGDFWYGFWITFGNFRYWIWASILYFEKWKMIWTLKERMWMVKLRWPILLSFGTFLGLGVIG